MSAANRVALVTGAGRRLGRAFALALASKNMRVAVHYNASNDDARETVALIEKAGGRAELFHFDLTDADAPQSLIDDVMTRMGRLDVLVNSAAIMERMPFGDITVHDWDTTFSLNLRAPFFIAQAAAKVMSNGGSIINVADLGAFETWPGYVPHSISKAGVVKMTESLARVLAPRLRVNAIAPGAVLLPDDWGEEERKRFAVSTPLEKIGTPDDAVAAMLFLLDSEFITGETIVVDGGRRIRK